MTESVRDKLAGALGAAYTIERELGGGGMSRVFLASEHALGRRVVVKVLSPELAAGVNAERFRREIQLVAQMQHSCIVPVLSTGIAGDLPWYTMPFVEGESLRARIAREGELPVNDVTRILRDVLEALSYAHERGIVHRDIKPENVLLTRHHALLTDFGVAKAVTEAAQAGGTDMTTLGTALGTPAYMAPEQATADPATDHRADIYAVGALAYEMLTGQQLFSSRSPQAMLAAQAVERPEPVERRRPNTPPALAALVMRALEKHPADRQQSADEMLRELDAVLTPGGGTMATPARTPPRRRGPRRVRLYVWTGVTAVIAAAVIAAALLLPSASETPPAEAEASVAVLPFANMSGSREDEYLSDGLSEELIAALSKVPGLQVAARTSSFAFKGRNEDARTIGERLGVNHILGGSVRRSGNRLRVSAQLTNVATGYNLWSDTYDRERTDVFALQDDLARAIVSALQVRLAAGPGSTRLMRRTTTDPEAYDLYLRARHLLAQRGESLPLALATFERAIQRDSSFAEAWAGLAETYYISATWRGLAPKEAVRLSEVAARRSLELDPESVDGHLALGRVHCAKRDFPAAESEFRQALQLDPESGRAHYFHAICLANSGRLRDAVREGEEATALEPLNAQFRVVAARAYLAGGQPDRALQAVREGLQLAPTLSSLHYAAAFVYLALRDTVGLKRTAEMMQRYAITQSQPSAKFFRAYARVIAGDTAGGRALIARELAEIPSTFEIEVAQFFSLVRDEERTMRALDLAYERLNDLNGNVNFPDFDWLRDRPRFQAFVRKYNIPVRMERLD